MADRLKSSAVAIALIAAALALCVLEFAKLCKTKPLELSLPLLLPAIPVYLLAVRYGLEAQAAFGFFCASALWHFLRKPCDGAASWAAMTFFAFVWIIFCGSFLYKLRVMPEGGLWLAVFVVAVAKASDTGALLCGKLLGRRKLIPHVSPGKTLEGFAGGLLTGGFVGLAMQSALPGAWHEWMAFAFGVALAFAAALGDLLESFFKRDFGVKDSGCMAKGLGGALDIMDSVLLSAPLACFLMAL